MGFYSVDVELPEDASEEQVMKTIDDLNNDAAVHGILVQLPLPSHVNVCFSFLRLKLLWVGLLSGRG